MITYEDFAKIELKTGKISACERVGGSDKLLKLQVDLGESILRRIVAGIGKNHNPEELVGKTIIVIANLEPRVLMGLTSEGMLLAASAEDGRPVLLTTDGETSPGVRIK